MFNPRPLVSFGLLLSVLLAAFPAFPESDEEGVLFYGEEMVSTPSRRSQPMEEAPAPVTVITREDIRKSGAITIPEVLALAAGIDTIRRSEANVEVSIRGFNSYAGNKVLVMLDSKPFFNLADSSVNWNLIPVSVQDIERIEIVRGPGSAIYGENAFFGTINIITGKPRGDSAGLRFGAGTNQSVAGGAGGSIKGFDVHAEHLELDRFSDQDPKIPNSLLEDLDAKPVVAKATVNRAFLKWQPVSGAESIYITGGYSQVDTNYQVLRTIDRMGAAEVVGSFRLGGVDYEAGLRVLSQEQEVSEPPYLKDPYQKFFRTDIEVRGVYSPAVPDVLVFGAAYSHRTVEDEVYLENEDNGVRQGVVSFFVENQLALFDKKLFLTAGVRADSYQDRKSVISPRAGLVYILSPRQSLKFGWGYAYRSPTLYELYGEDRLYPPWVFRGNSELEPECVSSWNLDWFYQDGENLAVSVSLFYNDLRNLVVYRLDSVSITERVYRLDNEDRASAYGGEIEARTVLTKKLSAWANYSYNEAVYYFDHEDIKAPFSPRHKANAGIDYQDENWGVSIFTRYVGEQVGVNFDAPFRNRLVLEDFGTINARLTLRFPGGVSLSATGSDLFGQGHYEAPTYAPVTPYYFVELKWEPER